MRKFHPRDLKVYSFWTCVVFILIAFALIRFDHFESAGVWFLFVIMLCFVCIGIRETVGYPGADSFEELQYVVIPLRVVVIKSIDPENPRMVSVRTYDSSDIRNVTLPEGHPAVTVGKNYRVAKDYWLIDCNFPLRASPNPASP